MTLRNYLAVFGVLLVLAGGMSPMLKIPVLGNWNYWDIDLVLASLVFGLAATGLLGAVLRKPGLSRYSGWGILLVLTFTLVAVYFKVNDYFSFIPLKKLARIATNMVHYQWMGWVIILVGSLVMIFSSTRQARKIS